jgi:hypothetical protein
VHQVAHECGVADDDADALYDVFKSKGAWKAVRENVSISDIKKPSEAPVAPAPVAVGAEKYMLRPDTRRLVAGVLSGEEAAFDFAKLVAELGKNPGLMGKEMTKATRLAVQIAYNVAEGDLDKAKQLCGPEFPGAVVDAASYMTFTQGGGDVIKKYTFELDQLRNGLVQKRLRANQENAESQKKRMKLHEDEVSKVQDQSARFERVMGASLAKGQSHVHVKTKVKVCPTHLHHVRNSELAEVLKEIVLLCTEKPGPLDAVIIRDHTLMDPSHSVGDVILRMPSVTAAEWICGQLSGRIYRGSCLESWGTAACDFEWYDGQQLD